MINSKKKIDLILIILLLFFTIFIRAYNIGYDDLWFDEISSYWVSDPRISINESLIRHNRIEKTPLLYFLILKINFNLFFYDSLSGRYLSLIFNILGIIFSVLTCKTLSNNKSYILALFIFASNIYLINYAQEMRVYSLMFFLSSLYLYLFIKINKFVKTEELNFLYLILISSSLVLMLISHPFCFLVFFSVVIYLIVEFFRKNKISKTLRYNIFFGVIFSIAYLFFLSGKIDQSPSWISQPNLKFYTNFYFSKFFGSRLLGLLHLVLFLCLIVYMYQRIFKKNSNLDIFLILTFLCYFLPIIFGYLIKPIILPRYIIFILIPIVILLSILVFEINNIYIRNSIITFLIIINVGNHFFEATFQQFFKERPFYKTNFKKMLNTLKNEDTKLYTINLPRLKDGNDHYYTAIENYISSLRVSTYDAVEYIEREKILKSNDKKIWIICLMTIVTDKCENVRFNSSDIILKEKPVPGMRMVLISRNL